MSKYKNELIPLYRGTKSLDVNHKFVDGDIEDAEVHVKGVKIHACLKAGCKGLLSIRNEETPIDKINIATAAVTFLYTETTSEEGYLGDEVEQETYAIKVNKKPPNILSTMDFYEDTFEQKNVTGNKAKRDRDFIYSLEERVGSFSNVANKFDVPADLVSDQKQLDDTIKSPMFHETFHHSEQAIMHHLSSDKGIGKLVNFTRKLDAGYVYGIVLDVYTQRMLCGNCNVSLLGMQHSYEKGFLKDLSTAFQEADIQPRKHQSLMLSTRVSASTGGRSTNLESLKLNEDKGTIHDYDPKLTNIIYQADNKALGTKKII